MRFTPFFIPNADESRLVLSEKGDAFSAFETQKGVKTKEGEPIQKIVEKYCGFIETHYNTPEYLHDIQYLENWVAKSKVLSKNEFVSKTLRMSLFG